jgi:hypothetical protein
MMHLPGIFKENDIPQKGGIAKVSDVGGINGDRLLLVYDTSLVDYKGFG